jgi:hypothetical protein
MDPSDGEEKAGTFQAVTATVGRAAASTELKLAGA